MPLTCDGVFALISRALAGWMLGVMKYIAYNHALEKSTYLKLLFPT